MFDDSGFGGKSLFDSNHDGHLDAFERDHAECFLHDCDTYDQVTKNEGKSRRELENEALIRTIKLQLKVLAILAVVYLLLIAILGP